MKLWDLRKRKSFLTIDTEQPVTKVKFDYSGTYLGVAAGAVRYNCFIVVAHVAPEFI